MRLAETDAWEVDIVRTRRNRSNNSTSTTCLDGFILWTGALFDLRE